MHSIEARPATAAMQRRQRQQRHHRHPQQQQQRRRHAAAATRALGCALALALALGAVVPHAAATDTPAAAAALPPAAVAPRRAGGDASRPQVVGGADAPVARLSHQLAFYIGNYFCGGSLLSRHVALTAAHCKPKASDKTKIAAGYTQVSFWSPPPNGQSPSRVMRHPYYKKDDYDATLVFLPACYNLSNTITTIKLATQAEMAAYQNATWLVSGWGTTSEDAGPNGDGGYMPKGGKLQYGLVDYIPDDSCLYNKYPDSMLCAGNVTAFPGTPPQTPLQDTCQGDSGGPLMFNTGAPSAPLTGAKADDRLAGVTSWGNGCGQYDQFGVYTDAAVIRDWAVWNSEAEPPPCAPASAPAFVAADAVRAFAGSPQRTVASPKNVTSDPALARAACESECLKFIGKASSKRCVAYVVTAKTDAQGATKRKCHIFKGAVPPRLCEDGETKKLCGKGTPEGSYRLTWV